MDLTKEEIAEFFEKHKDSVVDITKLSKTMRYNLGLDKLYKKGEVYHFSKGSPLRMHQFFKTDRKPFGVPTLCLWDGKETYISLNSLIRKGYTTIEPSEENIPTVIIHEGCEHIQQLILNLECGSPQIVEQSLTLTCQGDEEFIIPEYEDFKIKIEDDVICRVTKMVTQWKIEVDKKLI